VKVNASQGRGVQKLGRQNLPVGDHDENVGAKRSYSQDAFTG
jgi:hypothetical protein